MNQPSATADTEFLEHLAQRGFTTIELARELREMYPTDIVGAILHLARDNPDLRDDLGKEWGNALGVAYVDPTSTLIQYHLVNQLPEAIAKKHKILPLYEFGGAVTVAMPTPRDTELVAQVESYYDMFVSPLFAFPDQIESALEIAYNSESSLSEAIQSFHTKRERRNDEVVDAAGLRSISEDSAIIEFCRGIILYALKRKASDIHIEPGETDVRIRFRVDGVLQEILQLDRPLHGPIVARLKLIADTDIAETRRPQDGTIRFPLAYRSIDLRLSSMPTVYGEKLVLRILGQSQFITVPDLVELELSERNLRAIRKVGASPNGIFFLTGPTGSGKTTTLYALLKHINQGSINISTIENPVEYRLPGVNHTQINPAADVTFPTALRAMLRQDPDVILVGEIRDLETCTIACRAALTGHLVLTTLHTSDAVQTISRTQDLGMEPQTLAPAILGFMAQRLLRRLCPECREPYELSPEMADRIFTRDADTPVTFWRAHGCDTCNGIGYSGRIAIHEVLLVDDAIRAIISRGESVQSLRTIADSQGFTPMRTDGLKKVLRGMTSYEELCRVLPE